jgi:two-component system, sensor histidine kinase
MKACREPAAHRSLSGLRVLIIEDNEDGRETLRMLLELFGHEVEVAKDGVEGLYKALTWRPAVALVDVGLPVLDGYQVARCIRSVLGGSIFLIAHTGYGQPEDRLRALQAGFDAHLVKPVDWLELDSWLTEVAQTKGPQTSPVPAEVCPH